MISSNALEHARTRTRTTHKNTTSLLLLPALLIVWTYRDPRELVLALKLTSFGALSWGLIIGWGFNRFLL
jgi:hypothetical protein